MNIVDAIDNELQNLYLELQRIEGELRETKANISKLTKARNALTDKEPKQKKPKPKDKKMHSKAGEVLDLLRSEDVEFTADDVSRVLGIPKSSANACLSQLRDASQIDLVRMGGKTKSTKYFKAAMTHATIT